MARPIRSAGCRRRRRQLVNLKNIPVMIMAAEASITSVRPLHREYLSQAGVSAEYIRLQDRGIRGNGHM